METKVFTETDLVLNADGSVYHLHLKNEHIANKVILVGDQNRVEQISRHFDTMEYRIKNREFITHTGFYNGSRITVISTGIGTDNIDIVLNELYAATHINPENRQLKPEKRKLEIVRIGTSGALQPNIEVGSFVASAFGLGFDGLPYYYNLDFSTSEKALSADFIHQISWPKNLATPYFSEASQALLKQIAFDMVHGITATGTGFYAPQGRNLTSNKIVDVQQKFQTFRSGERQITNFDMETSALFSLGKMFEFECCTVNAIIANRATKTYLENHSEAVEKLIVLVLNRFSN